MEAPAATLRKVVLSRPVTVELDGPLHLAEVLRRLRAGEPNCTIFSMPVPDGTFFGASPELLVARHGDRVTAHPLAGTVRRGDTARRDADAQRELARSAKNREEHRYVVEEIAATLAPSCGGLSVPDEPSLVAFRSVAHLGTRIEGHLPRPAATILDLLGSLHPTPAVGGTPAARCARLHRRARSRRAGLLGRPRGLGRCRRRRRVDDRHPQCQPPRRRECGDAARRARASSPGPSPAPRRPRPTSSWPPSSRPSCRVAQCSCGDRTGGGGLLGTAASTWVAASGILTTSVAPIPVADMTSAVPCNASAMAHTMARPSPVPFAERDGSP